VFGSATKYLGLGRRSEFFCLKPLSQAFWPISKEKFRTNIQIGEKVGARGDYLPRGISSVQKLDVGKVQGVQKISYILHCRMPGQTWVDETPGHPVRPRLVSRSPQANHRTKGKRRRGMRQQSTLASAASATDGCGGKHRVGPFGPELSPQLPILGVSLKTSLRRRLETLTGRRAWVHSAVVAALWPRSSPYMSPCTKAITWSAGKPC
jgi:hypothetical protein